MVTRVNYTVMVSRFEDGTHDVIATTPRAVAPSERVHADRLSAEETVQWVADRLGVVLADKVRFVVDKIEGEYVTVHIETVQGDTPMEAVAPDNLMAGDSTEASIRFTRPT